MGTKLSGQRGLHIIQSCYRLLRVGGIELTAIGIRGSYRVLYIIQPEAVSEWGDRGFYA